MALKKFAAVELAFLRHNTIIMNSDTLRSAKPLECIKDAPDITEDTAIAAEKLLDLICPKAVKQGKTTMEAIE